jgi:hypothetical protein
MEAPFPSKEYWCMIAMTGMIGTEDNTDIVTSKTTISTTVNEGNAMGKKRLML